MSQNTHPTRAVRYLAELDDALGELPHRVATEIRAGIAEELDGLDDAAAAERIASLGDPRAIAAAAAEAGPAPAPAGAAASPARPLRESKGFAIAAALVLAFGGVVIPVAGWFVGAVMVVSSRMWTRLEKAIALATPFVAFALMMLATVITRALTAPSEDEARNPLVPGALDLWHSSILLAFILVPVMGGWLLWRMRNRTAPLR
ncbi:hypothetical protein GCM10025768_09000 [Microbacterium pseudoresistens]|uniref:Putative membrane protein n=1 Tax=Microbacterium pseudoresistens TaxID=640634 RepID=A0A7Y9JPM7_9MICO|nr:hypothetical protein [Microbacterium pseudoresistens]NYD54804.1 putative membrane protein [Microbacterium pseudoresistens]